MSKRKLQHQPNKPRILHEHSYAPTNKSNKRFWRDWEPMEKFTFVIALFTIVYSVVAIGQYFITKNTLVVSQRAFVYAKHANIVGGEPADPLPPNTSRKVDVTFGNSGQTWARNETATINFYFSKDGIPTDFTYPEDNPSQPVLIAPQAEVHLFKTIPESDFLDITGKSLKLLFVYGTVSYQDVFGDHRQTRYLFQYAGYELNPTTGKIVQYIFYQGPTHNCADNDCKPKNPN